MTVTLAWPGKAQSAALATPPYQARLIPTPQDAWLPDTSPHVMIEGDNLPALQCLQQSHHERIKCIYIDPPYNTGQVRAYQDDFRRRPPSAASRRGDKHAGWLDMMYPRLLLAHRLLRPDGVLFVSIDDHEAPRLALLLDEIFGQDNYVVTLYVRVRYPDKTLAQKHDFQKVIEQVLVYRKSQAFRPKRPLRPYSLDKFCWNIEAGGPGTPVQMGHRTGAVWAPGQYSINRVAPHIDGLKQVWATGTVLHGNASGKFFAEHLAPRKAQDGLGMLYKVFGIGEDGLGYRYFTGPKRAGAAWGKFYSGVPTQLRASLGAGLSHTCVPIVNHADFADAYGNCNHEGGVTFRGGKKPVAFLRFILEMCTSDDDIVLDFFAGSGSTGHAVMALNADDGGSRRFILIQRPEAIAGPWSTISALTRARLRHVGDALQNRKVELGYRAWRAETCCGPGGDEKTIADWPKDTTTRPEAGINQGISCR